MPLHISSNFDSGNIVCASADDPSNIRLEISKDNNSDFYMWFHFRLTGAKDTPCTLNITNAKGAAYPKGWEGYQAVASTDRENWVRVPTTYENGILSIRHTPSADSTWFAYFAPYSMERHADLIARSQLADGVSLDVLGETLDGQPMDLLRIGEPAADKQNYWAIARQHPGESMAEWWMEGCIERLLDENNAETKKLLSQCNVYLMPNMNPDGSRRGHLRTNAAGRNLNREWANPEIDASPEVYFVKQAMQEIGVDFLLDVHGDESLPYCFIAGTEGLSNWDEQKQSQLGFYKNKLVELNADFQTERGYPAKTPGTANLTMSTAQTAQSHACLAMTLEMPFKDTTATPDETYGWSGERSKKLAHSCLDALSSYLESGLL